MTYGDGASAALVIGADGKFDLSHVYADGPNNYTVTLTVNDEDGGSTVKTIAVRVDNVKPSITLFDAPVTPVALGSPITSNLKFTDPGVLDWADVVWSWEDGTTTPQRTFDGRAARDERVSHLHRCGCLQRLRDGD